MSEFSVTNKSIGGIPIEIIGLDELSHRTKQAESAIPVGVLFLLHGRLGHSKEAYLKRIANLVIGEVSSRPDERARELIVVILDQRNHGDRTVDNNRNKGWKDSGEVARLADGKADPQSLDNPNHLHDMYSLYTGTVNDLSFLITHLGPLLFPHDERIIDKYMVMGISLGGHAAWHIGSHDPRVSLVIPVIGSPSYLTLFQHRAEKTGLPLAPPYLPASLQREMESAAPRVEAFEGKDVLVLSGATDPLVPFPESGSKAFTERLAQAGCRSLEVWVQPETGHTVTKEMMLRAKEFIWARGVRREAESGARSNL